MDSRLISKDHFLQTQEEPEREKEKTSRRVNEQGAPGQIQMQIGGLERVEARTGTLGEIQRICLSN